MDTFEIRDDEIDVEEIMRQIRENIKKRRESGVYDDEMDGIINTPLSALNNTYPESKDDLSHDIDYINSNWNTNAEYYISSHRPIIGSLLIRGRQLVHGEVRRYVDILMGKQTEFNAHIVRSINKLLGRFEKIEEKTIRDIETVTQHVQELEVNVNSEIQTVTQHVQELEENVNSEIQTKVSEIQTVTQHVQEFEENVNNEIQTVTQHVQELEENVNSDIDGKISGIFGTINNNLENKAWLASILDDKIQERIEFVPDTDQDEVMNYFIFEEKYRGSCEDIKQRQSIFLEYFNNCQNVIDIGCGRGEFLSLLKENGIGAKGIDLNEDMVLYCRKNGLDVSQGNALTHLHSLEDKSLDGVFLGQVVEHLQPDELISLIKLCYDKMKFGTYFVAETVNPTCLSVFAASFYIDLSHVKPIHPATIKFLTESVGFRDVEFKFFSPFPDDAKLSKFEVNEEMDDVSRRQIDLMNRNIDNLNNLLYGYQDYAVIGKK